MLKAALVSQPSSEAIAALLSSAEATRAVLCPGLGKAEMAGAGLASSSSGGGVSGSDGSGNGSGNGAVGSGGSIGSVGTSSSTPAATAAKTAATSTTASGSSDTRKSHGNEDASDDGSVLAELERRACNADPNYGMLWLFCKKHQFDTALQVMRSARIAIQNEIVKYRKKYGEALLQEHEREREEVAAAGESAASSKSRPRANEVSKALNEASSASGTDRAAFSMGITLSASDTHEHGRRLLFA